MPSQFYICLLLLVFLALTKSREAPTAYIEIILYEPDQKTGRYLTKTSNVLGYFSTVGSSASAEGNIKLVIINDRLEFD